MLNQSDNDTDLCPISSPRRKLAKAQLQDENVQKSITTAEVARKMSTLLVGSTMQTALENIKLCDEFQKSVKVENDSK